MGAQAIQKRMTNKLLAKVYLDLNIRKGLFCERNPLSGLLANGTEEIKFEENKSFYFNAQTTLY